MKTKLLLILLLGASAATAQQNPELADYRSRWTNAAAYTLAVAEAMPDSAYTYRPTPDQMSFGQQILHLTSNMCWLSHAYLGHQPPGFDLAATRAALRADSLPKAAVLQHLRTGLDFAAQALTQLTPDMLEQEVDFFAGRFTRRRIVLLLFDHLTHHRAQAIVYLRLQGLEPPRYVGW